MQPVLHAQHKWRQFCDVPDQMIRLGVGNRGAEETVCHPDRCHSRRAARNDVRFRVPNKHSLLRRKPHSAHCQQQRLGMRFRAWGVLGRDHHFQQAAQPRRVECAERTDFGAGCHRAASHAGVVQRSQCFNRVRIRANGQSTDTFLLPCTVSGDQRHGIKIGDQCTVTIGQGRAENAPDLFALWRSSPVRAKHMLDRSHDIVGGIEQCPIHIEQRRRKTRRVHFSNVSFWNRS